MTGATTPRAVIVGIGPGLGAALARRFAAGGFSVAGLARDPARIAAIEGVSLLSADAADPPGLGAAINRGGPVEVLIYNAYRATIAPVGPSGLEPAALVEDFRVNVAGALAAVQAVLPGMRAMGRGSILLTGGGLALNPTGWLPAASLAVGKAGLRSLAQTLHGELEREGICVTTVTITGQIQPGTPFDPDRIAERYWQLHAQANGRGEWESVFRE